MKKLVVGKGIYTKGKYTFGKKGNPTKEYSAWLSMLTRCYSERFLLNNSSYVGCEVFDDWLNFQNFAEWFSKNYTEGYQLDKDLLIKGNKIYSPETCCFIPQEINLLLGNHKRARGSYPIGVSKQRNKFSVHLRIKNIKIHCGNFDTVDQAFLVYKILKENDIKIRAEEFRSIISNSVYDALINYKIEKED